MTGHFVTRALMLIVGVTLGVGTPAVQAQGSSSRSVVEDPTAYGGSRVVVEDRTNDADAGASRRTVREYGTNAGGSAALLQTVEERRVRREDGSESVVRDFSEPGMHGRTLATRRETQETVAEGNDTYRTVIEVSVPGPDADRFVATERVEQRERWDGDRVLESESVTYANRTQRGDWAVSEQRVVQHAYGDSEVESVESVYRPDGTGRMSLSDRIVRKEWVGNGGEEHTREEVFATVIAGQARTSEPQLHQQIDTVRTARADGSIRTTREVRERRGGRSVVVERTTERERPDGRGGTMVERETEYRDVNGRLRPVGANRTGRSGSS